MTKNVLITSNEEIKDYVESMLDRFVAGNFNDDGTRNHFIALMYDFIPHDDHDFVVVCDETNNTPDVIDANQFVADIYVNRQGNRYVLEMMYVPPGETMFSEITIECEDFN